MRRFHPLLGGVLLLLGHRPTTAVEGHRYPDRPCLTMLSAMNGQPGLAVTSDRTALERACQESLDEDTPRLMLRDWFLEQGDEARAEFIAVQIELAQGPSDARAAHLRAREKTLLAKHAADWRPVHTGLPSEVSVGFERGMPVIVITPQDENTPLDRISSWVNSHIHQFYAVRFAPYPNPPPRGFMPGESMHPHRYRRACERVAERIQSSLVEAQFASPIRFQGIESFWKEFDWKRKQDFSDFRQLELAVHQISSLDASNRSDYEATLSRALLRLDDVRNDGFVLNDAATNYHKSLHYSRDNWSSEYQRVLGDFVSKHADLSMLDKLEAMLPQREGPFAESISSSLAFWMGRERCWYPSSRMAARLIGHLAQDPKSSLREEAIRRLAKHAHLGECYWRLKEVAEKEGREDEFRRALFRAPHGPFSTRERSSVFWEKRG